MRQSKIASLILSLIALILMSIGCVAPTGSPSPTDTPGATPSPGRAPASTVKTPGTFPTPTPTLKPTPKPTPRPRREITFPLTLQEGVLYQDDFASGAANGWQLESDWEVVKDAQGDWALHGQGHNWATYSEGSWGDYTLELRLKLVRGTIHLNYRVSGCTRYFIGFDEDALYLNKTSPCENHPELRRIADHYSLGLWHDVKIVGKGSKLDIYVDGVLKITYADPEPLVFGAIAFETLADSEAYVDDIVVTGQVPLSLGIEWVKTGGPLGGLGYDVRIHPNNSDVLYVTDAWSGVNMSIDGGRTWAASNIGIVTRTGPSGDAIPVFSLTIDPHDPNVIWAGTQNRRGIFKSMDGGITWVEKDNGVVEEEGISFRGFTVDPRDPNIVYAAAEISSIVWAGEWLQGKEFDLTSGVVYKTTDGGATWDAIWRGDNLARYIWIDPRNPEVIYVSTGIFDREAANSDHTQNVPGGVGVVKSTDGGLTWITLGRENGFENLYIGSLFMHPENPDILLAGAGNNAYGERAGVYLSNDSGDTWQRTLSTGWDAVTSVEFSLSDPEIAYAGTASAFYRSNNGGLTWHLMNGGPSTHIWGPPGIRAGVPIDFQVDPRNANRIFANNYGGGNFLSEDGGRSWVVASQGYTGAQLHDIAVASTDPERVYAIGRTGPFYSPNGGTTWEGLNYEPATFAEWYAVALDPNNPNNVLVSDEHQGVLLQSGDGGRHWSAVFQHPEVDDSYFYRRHGFKAIAFASSNPSIVYAGMSRESRNINEGLADPSFGIYKSTDGGSTWHEANDSHTATQNINALVVHPRDPDTVYAGTVKGGAFKSTDGGQTWQPINKGLRVLDIRALAIDPQNPQVLYAGAENGGAYKSSDGGATWHLSSGGMDPQAAIRAIVIDPIYPLIVYAADLRTGVYRSDDGGKLWVRINDGLSTRAVTALAISSDGGTLYAATEGEGVFRLEMTALDGGS